MKSDQLKEKNRLIEDKWKAVRKRAGYLDLAGGGKILVKGKDRVSFLHNTLSNDIKGLAIGRCCYAALLTPKGKIISDLTVYALKDIHLMELHETNIPKVIERLNSYIITEDVEIKNITADYGIFSIQGPASQKFIDEVHLPPATNLFQNDRTGSGGCDIWFSKESSDEIQNSLQSSQICPIGLETLEILRIEAGIPVYGKELDENTIPNEANLERAISWTKGCYPGQEVVARIKYLGGVQRILSGLIIQGVELPNQKDKIFKDSNVVGLITSACFSSHLKIPIALAYLRTPAAIPGNWLQIYHGEKILNAEVKALPFYKK